MTGRNEPRVHSVDGPPGFERWTRDTIDVLCRATTDLSAAENGYVVTRLRMEPAWLIDDTVVEGFRLLCPLQRGHPGPHMALVGRADNPLRRCHETSPGPDWFIAWGPQGSDPRLIAPQNDCSQHQEREDGSCWVCTLMETHSGECRFNLRVLIADADFEEVGIDMTPRGPDDASLASLREKVRVARDRDLVDDFLAGNGTYAELGYEWELTERQVAAIIRDVTSRDERVVAMDLRRHQAEARRNAQFVLAAEQVSGLPGV